MLAFALHSNRSESDQNPNAQMERGMACKKLTFPIHLSRCGQSIFGRTTTYYDLIAAFADTLCSQVLSRMLLHWQWHCLKTKKRRIRCTDFAFPLEIFQNLEVVVIRIVDAAL